MKTRVMLPATTALRTHILRVRPPRGDGVPPGVAPARTDTAIDLAMLQRLAGNRATSLHLARTGTNGTVTIRREIHTIAAAPNGILTATTDAARPRTNLPPAQGQGDHMTPWSVLQGEIVNCINGTDLATAWANLAVTLAGYTALPGWAASSAWMQHVLHPYVAGLVAAGGDIHDLLDAANEMLRLRNQVSMTAVPNGGHGHGESAYVGMLQHHERQIQLGHALGPAVNAAVVMDYMWKAFEHPRHDAMAAANRALVRQQHVQTMLSAYWQVVAALGITQAGLSAHYGTQANWMAYIPP